MPNHEFINFKIQKIILCIVQRDFRTSYFMHLHMHAIVLLLFYSGYIPTIHVSNSSTKTIFLFFLRSDYDSNDNANKKVSQTLTLTIFKLTAY